MDHDKGRFYVLLLPALYSRILACQGEFGISPRILLIIFWEKILFLTDYFHDYFSNVTKPTARNLFLLVIAFLTLDTFRPFRTQPCHF